MHFSTSGRTSLALVIVVMMRPLTFGLFSSNSASRSVRNSALARLRARPADGLGLRPSFRPFRRCRMIGHRSDFMRSESQIDRRDRLIDTAPTGCARQPHAQVQAQLAQLML